ncbi:MAG TPA: LPS export ABC transporter periplasmic protein LptC [Asticcacaulis sp.]|nr:LPS export ABC transporter periplasmic protein LptC [Asticcacaulis sp.]
MSPPFITDITARFDPKLDAEAEAAERHARLATQVAAVRRRSRFIRQLRGILPAVMIGMLVFNFGWIAVTSIISSLNVYGAASTEIRMTNPRFSGLGSDGNPYTVSGLEAVRKTREATVVTLKAPSLEFRSSTQHVTHISAANGVYDIDHKTFRLNGNVIMSAGGSDMAFRTEEAVINMNDSSMSGDKHIEGNGSMGHIEGESFVISNNGDNIVFHGRGDNQVHGTFNRTKKK